MRYISALSLRLFGEDLTVAAREQGRKKKLAGPGAEATTAGEPGDLGDDRDGGNDQDSVDGDAEEHE